MDSARPGNPPLYLTLKQAAQSLAVSIDVLLSWNENNILKPTITPSGEIGYKKEQIDQFLAIRNSAQLISRENSLQNYNNFSQHSTLPIEKNISENSFNFMTQPTNNFAQINNYNFYETPKENQNKNKTLISAFGLITGFSIFMVIVLAILFSQENKIQQILNQNKMAKINNAKILAQQNSDLNNSKINTPESLKNKNNENLTNEGDSLSQKNSNILNQAFEEKEVSESAKKNETDKLAILKSILGSKSEDINAGLVPDSDTTTYSQVSNFENNSSCPNCDTEDNIFDTEGNIKVSKDESDKNKLLATSLSMGGFNQSDNSVKQTSSSITLVSFLILGLFSLYALYSGKKYLFPYQEGSQNLQLQPISSAPIKPNSAPKLMEIHQKTDGTVALFMHGNEFKLSKPELDSESDKFIERLMQLTSNGVKEIEYDILKDNLNINTPLSKLVTRLGFVGIKRDLFFPRTSKTQVYFRKYLTAEDLMSMNLTIEDVKESFNLVN